MGHAFTQASVNGQMMRLRNLAREPTLGEPAYLATLPTLLLADETLCLGWHFLFRWMHQRFGTPAVHCSRLCPEALSRGSDIAELRQGLCSFAVALRSILDGAVWVGLWK